MSVRQVSARPRPKPDKYATYSLYPEIGYPATFTHPPPERRPTLRVTPVPFEERWKLPKPSKETNLPSDFYTEETRAWLEVEKRLAKYGLIRAVRPRGGGGGGSG